MSTQIEKSYLDTLSELLFDGEQKAADIKTMPGPGEHHSAEEVAKELQESLVRVGLVKNGTLDFS